MVETQASGEEIRHEAIKMAPRMKSNYPVILIGVILRKEDMKRSHGDSLQNTTRKEGEHFALGSVLFCNIITLTLHFFLLRV